jgi:hypothetical protein
MLAIAQGYTSPWNYSSPGDIKGGNQMQIRRFSSDLKVKISGNHPGLYGVPIQMSRSLIPTEKMEEFAKRVNGLFQFLRAA